MFKNKLLFMSVAAAFFSQIAVAVDTWGTTIPQRIAADSLRARDRALQEKTKISETKAVDTQENTDARNSKCLDEDYVIVGHSPKIDNGKLQYCLQGKADWKTGEVTNCTRWGDAQSYLRMRLKRDDALYTHMQVLYVRSGQISGGTYVRALFYCLPNG